MASVSNFYENRNLADGYPELDQLAHQKFTQSLNERTDEAARMERLIGYLGRICNLSKGMKVVVLGCGPRPEPIACLGMMGYEVVGIEPVPSFVASAKDFLEHKVDVIEGAAEHIPLPDDSQNLVIFDSVLEHVDSIPKSLQEIFRVLAPGGLLFLTTTNRQYFSLTGKNGEFNVPFYNWFPRLVKESYVFKHLHYHPALANFTERPAVHWFTYADLCMHGRDAGFAQFYSLLDLVRRTDPSIAKSRLRRFVLPQIQRNPWLRALALTQAGHAIVMLKRK